MNQYNFATRRAYRPGGRDGGREGEGEGRMEGERERGGGGKPLHFSSCTWPLKSPLGVPLLLNLYVSSFIVP